MTFPVPAYSTLRGIGTPLKTF
ncbi:hypothetical protein [Hoylesella saccharolytica]